MQLELMMQEYVTYSLYFHVIYTLVWVVNWKRSRRRELLWQRP